MLRKLPLLTLLSLFLIVSCSLFESKKKSKSKTHSSDSVTELKHLPPDVYKIFSRASAKCLTYIANELEINLIQKDCDGSDSQLFKLSRFNEKETTISPLSKTSQCLGFRESESISSIILNASSCSAETTEHFTFKRSKLDPNFVNIWSKSDDRCLDQFEKSKRNGGFFHKYPCTYQSSQDFIFDNSSEPKGMVTKIWTYWDKGFDKMPAFYKANVKKWHDLLATSHFGNWEITVVNKIEGDPNYFENFFDAPEILTVEEISAHLTDKEKENKLNPHVIFSDFVRLQLLYNHGGIWIDPSIILHENFDDVFGALENISSINVLGYTNKNQATITFRQADSLENFYLAAAPKSPFIDDWHRNFKSYWEQKAPGKSITDHPMFNGSQGHKIDLNQFGRLKDYLNQHAVLKYTLTKNRDHLKDIFISGDTSSNEKGPFTLLEYVNWKDEELVKMNSKIFPDILNTLKDVKMSKFPSDNSKYVRFIKGDIRRPRHLDFFYDEKNLFGFLNKLDLDDEIGLLDLATP